MHKDLSRYKTIDLGPIWLTKPNIWFSVVTRRSHNKSLVFFYRIGIVYFCNTYTKSNDSYFAQKTQTLVNASKKTTICQSAWFLQDQRNNPEQLWGNQSIKKHNKTPSLLSEFALLIQYIGISLLAPDLINWTSLSRTSNRSKHYRQRNLVGLASKRLMRYHG